MERMVDGVVLRICFPFSHILVSHPCLCPQQNLNEYNKCCRKIGCVIRSLMARQALRNFFGGTRIKTKTHLPYIVHLDNIKTFIIPLNILFARQVSAIIRQVSGADWAAMPMHERSCFGGKGNLSAKWLGTDKAGPGIQMPSWSSCSEVGKEAGGEELGRCLG